MRALPALQKLAEARLDMAGRLATEADRALTHHDARLRDHADDLVRERARAGADPLALSALAAYALRHAQETQRLRAQRPALVAARDEARAALLAAHQETRKLERLAEILAEKADAEQARRDAAAMDEAATQRAARR
jgi:flagellar export protein FliJ